MKQIKLILTAEEAELVQEALFKGSRKARLKTQIQLSQVYNRIKELLGSTGTLYYTGNGGAVKIIIKNNLHLHMYVNGTPAAQIFSEGKMLAKYGSAAEWVSAVERKAKKEVADLLAEAEKQKDKAIKLSSLWGPVGGL